MRHLDRRHMLAISGAGLAALAMPLAAEEAYDPWPGLVSDLFDGRPMQPTDSIVSLEAPYRAEDAALVPITVRTALPAGDTRHIARLSIVVDKNPVPLAAAFEFGANSGVETISTRVRINEYTKLHVIAETSDGTLYVTEKFIKAAGGCSAPAMKNQDEAMASMGRLKFRQFAVPAGAGQSGLREAQIMIRHPNHSGFQRDQLTNLYIPARFINDIVLRQGDELIFRVVGGISLSEDPNIRFTFRHNGASMFTADFIDTEDTRFHGEWPAEPAGSQGT
jgi:sulfur-oxidizing protein SoxY